MSYEDQENDGMYLSRSARVVYNDLSDFRADGFSDRYHDLELVVGHE